MSESTRLSVQERSLPQYRVAASAPLSRHSLHHDSSPIQSGQSMPTDQYHEPPNELSEETRTYARISASLIEEAEAIGWYHQRLSLEKDPEASAIMRDAMKEEFKHFGMDLEFLLRKTPEWRQILQGILFKQGDIVDHADSAEKKSD